MLSSVFRLVVLSSCFLDVLTGQQLNWIEQDSNSLTPGNAQYYLSADVGSSVGPMDELKRTNRSLWKKLFKNTDLENLFCDNCNGNNYYGGGGCSSPLQKLPLPLPLPIVTKPLKPLFGALPQLWGSAPSTYYPPPPQYGCGGMPAGPYGSSGPYGRGYGGPGAYGGGGGYGANGAGGYNGPAPGGPGSYNSPAFGGAGGYNGPARGGAGGYSAPAPGGSSDYNLPAPGGSGDYSAPAPSGAGDYSDSAPGGGTGGGNADYSSPSPTPPVENYESPAPSPPASSYEAPVAPASNSYDSGSDADYAEPKSTGQGNAKTPQILYQPIIYVSPQLQTELSKKSSYGSASDSSGSNNKSYGNHSPVEPEPEPAYKPPAPVYDDQPEPQAPEPEPPAPAYTPPPAAPSIPAPPAPPCTSCGGYMPIFGFPVYGMSPPVAALPTPLYQNQLPWQGHSSLTPANYGPPQAPAPYPAPSAYSSPNSISYSSPGSESAKSEYDVPQLPSSSAKSPSPSSGSYVPPGVTTISTVYTVVTPPKPGIPSNPYSASSSALAPPPPPTPCSAYQASPPPAAASIINTYPMKLTYADQPFRSCPELFSEYQYQQALAAQTGNGY